MAAPSSSQLLPVCALDAALHLPRIQRLGSSTRVACPPILCAACSGGRTSYSADQSSCGKDGIVDLVIGCTRKKTSIEWTPLLKTGTQDWSSILTVHNVQAQTEVRNSSQTEAQSHASYVEQANLKPNSTSSSGIRVSARKVMAVSFTPEKAKLLRKTLRASEAWQDTMYHSAIASRLASPEL